MKVNVRVTSPYPDPLPPNWRSDLDFELYDSSPRLLGGVITAADNETLYLHGIPSGWYYLYVNYSSVVYADSSNFARYAVSLETGTGFGIGYVSGRVVDGNGQGIANVIVGMGVFPYDNNLSRPNITTGPDGTFTVAYTPGTYDLLFSGDRYFFVILYPHQRSQGIL